MKLYSVLAALVAILFLALVAYLQAYGPNFP